MDEISRLTYRVDAVEKAYSELGKEMREAISLVKIDMNREMVRLDEGVRGVREQAKAHNEISAKAIADLNQHVNNKFDTAMTLIANTGKELQQGQDKIISSLGIDEEPGAGKSLRENLAYLSKSRRFRDEIMLWVWRSIAGLVVTGIGTLLLYGIYFGMKRAMME